MLRLPRPLPNAPVFWGALVGGFVGTFTLVDIWCDAGDPDGDTFTEWCRTLIDTIPHGRELFAAGCVASLTVPALFYRHIAKEWT